jgi:hypothetical protein
MLYTYNYHRERGVHQCKHAASAPQLITRWRHPAMRVNGQVWGGIIGARGGMCGRSINTRVHSGAECECKSSVDQFKVEQAPIVRSTEVCWTHSSACFFILAECNLVCVRLLWRLCGMPFSRPVWVRV